jgi:hypothetical protein
MPIQTRRAHAGHRSPSGSTIVRRSDPWLVGLMLAGVLLRAAFLTTAGYENDVAFWKSYLTYSTAFGIQNVYGMDTSPLQPYPPVFLYLLWGIGLIYTGLLHRQYDSALLTGFVKLPAVAADLVVALLMAAYVRRRAGPGVLSPRVAAGIIALHPALIWISAYWGQVDILHGAICAGAWAAAYAGLSGATGGLLALGVMTKPQGLVIVPAVAALLFARSGVRGLARALGTGIVVVGLLSLPFLLAGYAREVAAIYLGAADLYPYVSVYAFNPWWIVALLLGGGREAPLVPDTIRLFGSLTPRALGMFLFLAATAWICARCLRAGRGSRFTPGRGWRLLTLQWLAFFLLPTHVHERYLAPALVSMAPAVLLDRRWRWGYGVLSLGVLLNVAYVLPGSRGLLTIIRILAGEGIVVALALAGLALALVRAEVRESRDASRP